MPASICCPTSAPRVTGEVMHVDAGYHVVGMIKTSSAKQIAELLGNFEGE